MKLSEIIARQANELEDIVSTLSEPPSGFDRDRLLHYFQEQSGYLVQLANQVEELRRRTELLASAAAEDQEKIEEVAQNLIDLEAEIPVPDDEDITAPEEDAEATGDYYEPGS